MTGKRIVQLQASLALAQSTGAAATPVAEDTYGRKPFAHPALDGLKNLSADTKAFLTSKEKLAELAQKYEMQKVLRWAPRHVSDSIGRVEICRLAIVSADPSPALAE